MPPELLMAVLLVILLLGGVAVSHTILLKVRTPRILDKWARENGYSIIKKEPPFCRGPFIWSIVFNSMVSVYRVTVEDGSRRRRVAWVRMGSLIVGALSRKMKVKWEGDWRDDANMSTIASHPSFGVKRRIAWPLVLVGGLVAGSIVLIALLSYHMSFPGTNVPPTLIENLRSGAITVEDIAEVQVMKEQDASLYPIAAAREAERPLGWWPRRRLAPRSSVAELVRLLSAETTDGHQLRDDPGSYYAGGFEITLRDGTYYFLFYWLGKDEDSYFTWVTSYPKLIYDPIYEKEYENVPLAEFLKKHDPWYRDENTPLWR